MRSALALRALAAWALPAVGLDSGVIFQARTPDGLASEGGSVAEDASASAWLAKDGAWINDEAMMFSILQGLSRFQDTAQRHAHVLAQKTGYNLSEGHLQGALGELERLRELLQGSSGAALLDSLRELQAKVLSTANRPDVRQAMQAVADLTLIDPETPSNTISPASLQETRTRAEKLELWARRQAKAPAVARARDVIAAAEPPGKSKTTSTDKEDPESSSVAKWVHNTLKLEDDGDYRPIFSMTMSSGFTGGLFPSDGSGTYCEFTLPIQLAGIYKPGTENKDATTFAELRAQEGYEVGTILGSGHQVSMALTESRNSREFTTLFQWPARIRLNREGEWLQPASHTTMRLGGITQVSFGMGANFRFNLGAYWYWTWSFNSTGSLSDSPDHSLTFTVDMGVGPVTLGGEFSFSVPSWTYVGGAVAFTNEAEQKASLMSILDQIYKKWGNSKDTELTATGQVVEERDIRKIQKDARKQVKGVSKKLKDLKKKLDAKVGR